VDTEAHYYFKLKHNIQNDSELELAKLEVEKLLGKPVEEILNFIDVLSKEPLKDFLADKGIRPQDFMTRLPYPGALQGYYLRNTAKNCLDLITRLAYFRDFFILVESEDTTLAKLILPTLDMNKLEFTEEVRIYDSPLPYAQIFTVKKNSPKMLLRLIPLHTLYEPSDFICRLALKIQHVDRMFEESIQHIRKEIYRPFSPSSARWFKRIGDFIDEREAPQLYLTHYIFGIHGKFFPRMISAIMNIADINKGECVLDPFCGCGTMNVEAAIRGINSIGIDMQPLFTMITELKIKCMDWNVEWLRSNIERLLNDIRLSLDSNTPSSLSRYIVDKKKAGVFLPDSLMRGIQEDSLEFIQAIKHHILDLGSDIQDEESREDLQNFCKLPLAYWMRSMLKKQDPKKIFETYSEYLWKMFYSVYYFNKFRKSIYKFDVGKVTVRTYDVRKLVDLDIPGLREGVDGIITSPPYGTAIDYVGDHVWALYVLDLVEDHLQLDEEMHIGTPRVGKSTVSQILEKSEDFLSLPDIAQKSLLQMAKNGREQKASAFYKYFVGMRDAFEQMSSVLKDGKRLVMIIGKQQVVSTEKGDVTIELGQIMEEIGKTKPADLRLLSSMDIGLQKASERGAIPTEHVIFFRKH
jgi:site-specific DNA-methyltransferase (cytosine-N4-specific)